MDSNLSTVIPGRASTRWRCSSGVALTTSTTSASACGAQSGGGCSLERAPAAPPPSHSLTQQPPPSTRMHGGWSIAQPACKLSAFVCVGCVWGWGARMYVHPCAQDKEGSGLCLCGEAFRSCRGSEQMVGWGCLRSCSGGRACSTSTAPTIPPRACCAPWWALVQGGSPLVGAGQIEGCDRVRVRKICCAPWRACPCAPTCSFAEGKCTRTRWACSPPAAAAPAAAAPCRLRHCRPAQEGAACVSACLHSLTEPVRPTTRGLFCPLLPAAGPGLLIALGRGSQLLLPVGRCPWRRTGPAPAAVCMGC